MSKEDSFGKDGNDMPFEAAKHSKSYKKSFRTYRKGIGIHVSQKKRRDLDSIAVQLDSEDVMLTDVSFYMNMNEKLKQRRFEILTGYGQCRGNLVVNDRDVIICCCRDMARAVSFEQAHMHNGSLYMNDPVDEICSSSDQTSYIIDGGRPQSTEHCPFCGAPVNYLEPDDFQKMSCIE